MTCPRLRPSSSERATMLGGVKVSLAPLAGCADLDPPRARLPRNSVGDGRNAAPPGALSYAATTPNKRAHHPRLTQRLA